MPSAPRTNKIVVLASRPQGMPTPDNFRIEEGPVPSPRAGEVLLELCFLSLDPYMRGRMSDAPSYVEPYALDAPLTAGAVARVIESHHEGFAVGELVLGRFNWQHYFVSDGIGLTKIDPKMEHPSYALGTLGMPGFTAWYGLLKIGRPRENETIVVAAAAGAVGSVVGQIAKIKGARVVGIAGGAEKGRIVVEELGFDVCLDHRAPDFAEQLAAACPDGIDVYFENVGGAVFDAVLPLLNEGARIPVCGIIAQYNATGLPEGPDRTPLLLEKILKKRLLMQGFIIVDHYDEQDDFLRDVSGWVAEGRIHILEDMVERLENAPEAFIGLLKGHNKGKLVIRATP
jgi:NADPH-dependent curcumin reductase CurA